MVNSKKIFASALAGALCLTSAVPAFAASQYTNSIASVAGDSAVAGANDVTDENKVSTGYDKNQAKQTEYTTITDQDTTSQADVYATQASTFTVKIPKVLVLDGSDTTGHVATGAYKVMVKGNISGTEVVTVAPAASFKMAQTGKTDIDAAVTQANTTFGVATTTVEDTDVKTVTEQADFVEPGEGVTDASALAEGSIRATGVTAGSWHGAFNFTISIA